MGSTTESPIRGDVAADLRCYLDGMMEKLGGRHAPVSPRFSGAATPQTIFDILTERSFCYLSKSRVAPYRDEVFSRLEAPLSRGSRLPIYFDIGGGYHASLRPGRSPLDFSVGLAELLIVSQIAQFDARVREVYSPGVRFHLVVDNVCALRTNDIPLECTTQYCQSLRRLIGQAGMSDVVDVIVESEEFPPEQYRDDENHDPVGNPLLEASPRQCENVARFLGRTCSRQEAFRYVLRYESAVAVSERRLDTVVQGVHLTQRATPTTLCFRPFPGGDSRVQCGRVALTRLRDGALHPILLTSRNIDLYDCESRAFPDVLPPEIGEITFAVRKNGESDARE